MHRIELQRMTRGSTIHLKEKKEGNTHKDTNKDTSMTSSKSNVITTEKQNDLTFDLFNLCAHDTHPIDISQYKKNGSEYLMTLSQQNTQFLIDKLFELPTTVDDDGLFATLPTKQITAIPREKPVPKEKQPTEWEQFAKKKNIRLMDRENLVYDSVHDEFRPRFGFGRANNELADDWVIEAKANETGGVSSSDPFLERQLAKKKATKLQLKNQKKNMAKSQGKTKIPAPVNIAALPRIDGKRVKFDLKDDLQDTYSLASVSTASMGKFDKKSAKKPKKSNVKPKNKISSKANIGGASEQTEEKAASLKLLDRILKKNAQKKKAIKSNAANTFQQFAEQQNRSNKKIHLLSKNKTRFTQGKSKGGKGPQVGKKRGRNTIDF